MKERGSKPFERKFEPVNLPKPREAFLQREVPFAFRHKFSNGTTLIAEQDPEGLGHVTLARGEDIVIDLNDDLPDGYKMITPTYWESYQETTSPEDGMDKKSYSKTWKTDFEQKLILLSDMQDIRQLLLLLHEIGHTVDGDQQSIHDRAISHGKAMHETKDLDEKRYHLKKSAQAVAERERRAWTLAIKRLREISDSVGFDMKEIFPDHTAMRNYIHTHLDAYRTGFENLSFDSLLFEDQGFLNTIERAFHGSGPMKKEA